MSKPIKINFIKNIEILAIDYSIIYDKTTDGGNVSQPDSQIEIGIKSYKIDPKYTLSVISHEIMEAILMAMGARFTNERTQDNHLFNFDHQTFENAIQLHTSALLKFIK